MTASQVVERFDPLENTLAGILPCLESVAINQFDFNGGHLQRPIRQRYALIQGMKTDYPIELLCDTLQVSRSGYYAWQSSARSRRSESDAALCTAMRLGFRFRLGKG